MNVTSYNKATLDTLLAGKATPAQITAAITQLRTDLLAGAPGALDTLNELAAALGNDQNYAATITTALNARPTAVQVAATYLPLGRVANGALLTHPGRALRRTAMVMGDSNTVNPFGTETSSTGSSNAPNWFSLLCLLSKRILNGGNFSRASYTTAQVRDAKLAGLLAVAPAPGAVFIMLGTNDIDLGGNGSTFDLTAATTAYVDILASLIAAGILPIIVQPIPNGTAGAAVIVNQQIWNRRLRELGAAYRVPVLDAYTPLVDATTGGIIAAYAQDSKHINDLGRRVLATALLGQGIADYFPPATLRTAKTIIDATNLVPGDRALFTSTANFTKFGDTANFTVTQLAPAAGDDLKGYWRRMVSTSAALTNHQMASVTPAAGVWAAGTDRLSFSARLRTSGVEAAKAAGLAVNIYVRIAFGTTAGGATVLQYLSLLLPSPTFDVDLADCIAEAALVVPAGAEKFWIETAITGASTTYPVTLDVGEMTLRNLTALGSYTY